MNCQTPNCPNEAAWFVAGNGVPPHYCCQQCFTRVTSVAPGASMTAQSSWVARNDYWLAPLGLLVGGIILTAIGTALGGSASRSSNETWDDLMN